MKTLLLAALIAANTISLPDLKPSEWFDGKMGGTFGAKTVTAFAKMNRVAVAGFRVVFVTHNEARAFVGATYHHRPRVQTLSRTAQIVFKGDDGALSLTKALDTDVEFAEMFIVDTKTGKVLGPVEDNVSKKQSRVAETTNEAYAAAADAVLSQATGAFARLFAENAPK